MRLRKQFFTGRSFFRINAPASRPATVCRPALRGWHARERNDAAAFVDDGRSCSCRHYRSRHGSATFLEGLDWDAHENPPSAASTCRRSESPALRGDPHGHKMRLSSIRKRPPACCRACRAAPATLVNSAFYHVRDCSPKLLRCRYGGARVTATLQVSLEGAAAPVGFNYVVLYDSRRTRGDSRRKRA
jgi:hypothetical protein